VDGFVCARLADFSAYAGVMGLFAIVATILASIGVYGIISYSVAQRTLEIAMRVALGATGPRIFVLVGRRAFWLISIGMACGFVGALALAGRMADQLWGVTPTDLTTFAGVSALLVLVALLACFFPARRAIHVNPAAALRTD
jgi:putative ABC transport system permease protein